MSIICGILPGGQEAVHESQLLTLTTATSEFAPDGSFIRTNGRIGMAFQPFYTHQRSYLEAIPVTNERGDMVAVDGRLDNYSELSTRLNLTGASDSTIILAAFEKWGSNCFSYFVGQWAIAIWSHLDESLYLARDHAGGRTLYFQESNGGLLWSTFLESFFAPGTKHSLDEGYIARYLACERIGDLTPYKGIRAVLPAHYIRFSRQRFDCVPHWQWMVKGEIHYREHSQYREQFLSLLSQSVERNTGAGGPILAELSGGIDSSGIVCVSDRLRRESSADSADLLDTVSYYDDGDPDWDELPYISAIEQQRSKRGLHLALPLIGAEIEPSPRKHLLPGSDKATHNNELTLAHYARLKGFRTILSGFGGDELLGGVASALPELADYLISGRVVMLGHQMLSWCLVQRTPIWQMTWKTLRFAFDQYHRPQQSTHDVPPWYTPQLRSAIRSCPDLLSSECSRLGFLPSKIDNGDTWWTMLETLPHLQPGSCYRPEYRYPYLDRDLVEFLFRVPCKVLLQPGRRRCLMRDALRGIVPDLVLERRRKGRRSRSVLVALRDGDENLRVLLKQSFAVRLGLASTALPELVVNAINDGGTRWLHPIVRLIHFELWVRTLETSVLG